MTNAQRQAEPERDTRSEDQPGAAGTAAPERAAALLDAAASAIDRALSGHSQRFLQQAEQRGGQ